MTVLSPTSHSQSGETKAAGPTGTGGPTKTKTKHGLTVSRTEVRVFKMWREGSHSLLSCDCLKSYVVIGVPNTDAKT